MHPLLLIGRIKRVQPFERRVIIGAERLRGFFIAGQIRRPCADAKVCFHTQKCAERPQGAEQVAVFGVIRIHGQPRGAVRITSRVARLHAVVELAHERVTVEQIFLRVINRLSGIVLRPDQVERAEILKRNAEFPFEIRVNGFHIVNVLRHLRDGKQRRKHSKFGAFRAVVAPHGHDDIFNALCVAGIHCLAHSRDAERVVRRKARPCPKSAREPRTAFDCVVGVNISLIALPVAAKIIPVHQVNILRHQLSDFLRNFAELRVLIEIGKVIPARQTEEHIAPHQKLEAIFFRHF